MSDNTNRKKRKPRARKNELELQKRLEKYKIANDDVCETAWMAYKWEKNELDSIRREERKRKKEEQPPLDRIRALLSESSRMNQWATTLKEQGKDKQAQGVRKAAERSLTDASNLYLTLDDTDKTNLDKDETNWLKNLIIPPYPYLCSDSDMHEMEIKERGAQISDLRNRCKQLEQKVQAYEQMLRQEKTISVELRQEIENLLDVLPNSHKMQSVKKKVQELLSAVTQKELTT
jgi:hypothetical protein